MRAKRSPGSGRLGETGALRQRTISATAMEVPPLTLSDLRDSPVKNGNKGLLTCPWAFGDGSQPRDANLAPQNQSGAYNLPLRNQLGTGNPKALSHQPPFIPKSSDNRVILRSLERRRPLGLTPPLVGLEVTECGTNA